MFEFKNLSNRARKSINLAIAEARFLGHNFIGSEQLLLGVLGIDEAIAQSIGVNIESARAEVEKIIGRGSGYVATNPPLTPRAKRIVQIATATACEHSFVRVEPEHILLAIAANADGVASKILENLGVLIPQLQSAILTRIRSLPQHPVSPADEIDESATSESSLLPAIPPTDRTAPTLLNIMTLPQENGRWVAQASTCSSGAHLSFRSIAYGDTDFQAIANALESLAQMYRNYQV